VPIIPAADTHAGPGAGERPALLGAPLGDVLVALGFVAPDDWETATRLQPDSPETYLIGRGQLTQAQLAEARAVRWGLEWRRLEALPDPALSRQIPDDIRARWPVAVLESTDDELVVAVADPEPVQLRDALREASGGRRLRLVVVPQSDLPPAEDIAEAEMALEETDAEVARLRALGQDTFIVRLTTDIIERAISVGASDIHIARFDEGGTGCEARLRVDGQLQVPGIPIPRRALPGVISRLLLLAGCDISQHRLPQSGKIPWPSAARPRYDLRIETSPDARGEHAVVRIFTQTGISTIEGLGFTQDIAQQLDALSRLPHGLVLVCGRTGCGKSTTLAVLVRRIHALFPGKAIYTVEDPVEQAIPGIVQVPVDVRAERTFPVLLRSALRKNPDVIMVGEIRDIETAQIAVQAALTGHLVLGTLHTNTAAAAIPRLINLGIPHYYVADVLRAVLSQRLVRATCRQCGAPAPISAALRRAFPALPETERVGRGCSGCYQGYVGRLPIGELLIVTEEIASSITASTTALEIQRLSRAPTLIDNGIEQVRRGRTTVSEVLREALWVDGLGKSDEPAADVPAPEPIPTSSQT
jgi:general secretion pathway protein E